MEEDELIGNYNLCWKCGSIAGKDFFCSEECKNTYSISSKSVKVKYITLEQEEFLKSLRKKYADEDLLGWINDVDSDRDLLIRYLKENVNELSMEKIKEVVYLL